VGGILDRMRNLSAADEGFTWNACDVDTRASNHTSFDHSNAFASFGLIHRERFSRLAAPEYKNIECFCQRHFRCPFGDLVISDQSTKKSIEIVKSAIGTTSLTWSGGRG
jgi:hypothetical protein